MQIELKGIIKRPRKIDAGTLFTLADGKGKYNCISRKPNAELREGLFVSAVLEKTQRDWELAEYMGLSEKEFLSFLQETKNNISIPAIEPYVKNETTLRMHGILKEAAKELKLSELLGREAVIRFNNDADGISSALLVSKITNGFFIQHNSAIYTKKDAFADISSTMGRFKPLVLLLDFGANDESTEALEILHSSGVEVIIIDHHPFSEKNKNFAKILNPHEYGEDASALTTGYLCFEIARALGKEDFSLCKISLAGDKSTLVEIDEDSKKAALVLDYASSYSGFGSNLIFYKELLENKSLFSTVYVQAEEKLFEVRELAKKYMKKEDFGPVALYTLDLDKISIKSEFPSRGKITSQLYELVKDECAVIVGTAEKSIIFRLTESAYKKGISAKEIIESLKLRYNDSIESGGGHAKAAAMRLRDETKANFLLSEIREMVKKA